MRCLSPAQTVERLLHGDVPVQVVAPVAPRAFQAFPFDQPLQARDDALTLGGGRGERMGKIDAAGEEQRRTLPGFCRIPLLLLPVAVPSSSSPRPLPLPPPPLPQISGRV